jgi:peptidoglycan/xylan/chitin deacetylase (PgdA/CDA1 family)
MYQYVRDVAGTPFPNLKGIRPDDFRLQIAELETQFEMASIESAMDFLAGEYRPRRDLCLLTFDDGLKEHLREVTPILAEKRIPGVFFLITSCIEERKLATVHMNDFLMAKIDFEDYVDAFFKKAVAMSPEVFAPLNVDPVRASTTYPWDTREVACFKYLFNFGMDPDVRDRAVRELFAAHVGDEAAFADSLYITWEDARRMQKAGMTIGGHTHLHKPLADLTAHELNYDLETCSRLLRENLNPQAVWAFSYPDGKKDSFHVRAMRKLQQLGFRCAFSTEVPDNRRGNNRFNIGRTDCNEALVAAAGV